MIGIVSRIGDASSLAGPVVGPVGIVVIALFSTSVDSQPIISKTAAEIFDPLALGSLAQSSDIDFGIADTLTEAYVDLFPTSELSVRYDNDLISPILETFEALEAARRTEVRVGTNSPRFSQDGDAPEQRRNQALSTVDILNFMVNVVPNARKGEPTSYPGVSEGTGNRYESDPADLNPFIANLMVTLFSPTMTDEGPVTFSLAGFGEFTINYKKEKVKRLFKSPVSVYEYGKTSVEKRKLPETQNTTSSMIKALFNVLGNPAMLGLFIIFAIFVTIVSFARGRST